MRKNKQNDVGVLLLCLLVASSILASIPTPVFASSIAAQRANNEINNGSRSCYAGGLYWVFIEDSLTSKMAYATSPDGSTWSAKTDLTTSGTLSTEAFWCSTTNIYYTITNAVSTVYYREGTLNSGGTITWAFAESSFTQSHPFFTNPATEVDTNGVWWFAAATKVGGGGNVHLELWYCSVPSSCSWTSAMDQDTLGTTTTYVNLALSASGPEYWYDTTSNNKIFIADCTTAGCGAFHSTSATYHSFNSAGGAIGSSNIGNTVEMCAFDATNHLTYLKYVKGATSFATESNPGGLTSTSYHCQVVTDNNIEIAIFYTDTTTSVSYIYSVDSGATWSTLQSLATGETNPPNNLAPYPYVINSNGIVSWTSHGAAGPCASATDCVKFGSVTLAITYVSVTTIGPCTFFQLQCWWYPLLFMGLYSGTLLMVASMLKTSPRGKAHIFLSAATFGSLIAVILGIMNIVFPLMMLAINTIIVLRLRG